MQEPTLPSPDEFMEFDSIETILAMVERGLGSAIVLERRIGWE